MWGLGVGGGEIEWPTTWRTLCSDVGQLATPPPPGGGGGGREHGCSRPSPFLQRSSLSHPPTLGSRDSVSPWGSVASVAGPGPAGRYRLAFDFALSFSAHGNPVSGSIREWPPFAILGMPTGLSIILAPWALPQSKHCNNLILICDNKDWLFCHYSCYCLCRYSVDTSGLGLNCILLQILISN
jgi:hypothetical protein